MFKSHNADTSQSGKCDKTRSMSGRLRTRKVANIERTGAPVIAAGNIGCIEHIAQGTDRPVVHTVQLLDWALGGPKPANLTAK